LLKNQIEQKLIFKQDRANGKCGVRGMDAGKVFFFAKIVGRGKFAI